MIPKPKCHTSNQVANKVCINKLCTIPAFICNQCQDDECQQLHYHDQNKLQVARWSQIGLLTQKIELSPKNKQFLQTLDKLSKQINKLADDMNSIIQFYRKRIQYCDKKVQIDPQFKRVWDNMKEEKWNLITGKQIKIMYDRIKFDNFIINKEKIDMMKDKQTQNVKSLVESINQKLSAYIKNDNVTSIPQNWSKEDQQQLEKYNQQIEKNPKNSYINRGLLYYNRKQFEKALYNYNKAIQCHPKSSIAYNNRGFLYYKQNQIDKALNDYNEAIKFDPKQLLAYINRGLLYHNRNEDEKALSDYTKAIECDPKDSRAYYNRGLIYKSRNKLEQALKEFTKAIECTKKALYYRVRAQVYKKLNRIKQAEIDMITADKLNSK